MTDKETLEFQWTSDKLPHLLKGLVEMLMDGFSLQVTIYDHYKSGKQKGEWFPLTRLQLRAWKS